MRSERFHHLALNGGRVSQTAAADYLLSLPATPSGYADAQIDDYGQDGVSTRKQYPWRPGTRLQLRARFSHGRTDLRGTAGFGFWNAPYGDPRVKWPALPQAAWFFFASPPNDLPFHTAVPGRGWFAATLDVRPATAALLAPVAPFVVLLNQNLRLRERLWPAVQQRLRVAAVDVPAALTQWHAYELIWHRDGCTFCVDGREILATPFTPRGPLGFVAWIDNQYLITAPHGRVGWGTLPTSDTQELALAGLRIEPVGASQTL